MKTYLLNLIFSFLFISCNPQEETKTIINKPLIIEYNFYPSSGGSSIYRVTFEKEQIKIIDNEKIASYSETTSRERIQDILNAYEVIKKSENVQTEIILDSWRIELKINGELFYNKSGVKISDLPTDVKNLLELLIKNSTLKIELYDFS